MSAPRLRRGPLAPVSARGWVALFCMLACTASAHASRLHTSPSAMPFVDAGGPFRDDFGGTAAAWGDYDGDGDLDLAYSGVPKFGGLTRLYRNEGAGVFVDAAYLFTGGFGAIAWGDFDNDADLDLIGTGDESPDPATKLFRNTGSGFVQTGAFAGVWYSSVAWGDFTRDGRLDVLVSGSNAGPVTRLYRNETNATFVDAAGSLTPLSSSASAWADFDRDSDLDLLIAGHSGSSAVTRLYRNDAGTLIDSSVPFPGVSRGACAWGDYDADGDLDLALAGYDGSIRLTRVYRNDGGAFADLQAGLIGAEWSSVAWGDADNDGDLDLALGGWAPGGVTQFYRNDGAGFSAVFSSFDQVEARVAWGDADGDGRLDLFAGGYGSAKLYLNQHGAPNTHPTAPGGLSAWQGPDGAVTFQWDVATDAETPAAGLTYNLRVGTTPGGQQIVSPHADAGGWRRIPAMGNTSQTRTWTLGLPPGTYYWSVQAIDGAFAGSPFAPEQVVTPGVSGVGDAPRAFAPRAWPNPFASTTTVDFDLPRAARVTLRVHDLSGRLVRSLVESETRPAGRCASAWDGLAADGRRVPAGVYVAAIEVDSERAERRIVRLP
jgi:hypothetical protein